MTIGRIMRRAGTAVRSQLVDLNDAVTLPRGDRRHGLEGMLTNPLRHDGS